MADVRDLDEEIAGRIAALSVLVETALIEVFRQKLGTTEKAREVVIRKIRFAIDGTRNIFLDEPDFRKGMINAYIKALSRINLVK